jgi:UTP--glucose-1-phosphate uridylyltransferase
MAVPLPEQLRALPPDLRAELGRYHFDAARLCALASASAHDNVVAGQVSPPHPDDIRTLPERGSVDYQRLETLGRAELAAGRVALVVLAGGMATRMGGVVKALVEPVPGRTFLSLRLGEVASIARRYGTPPPLWLMTSHATEAALRNALRAELDGDRVATFPQCVSLRLTPSGELYRDASGGPSRYASGHGDLPEALQQSGLLGRFVARGGRVVLATNLDNLGGTLDPAIIGWHVDHGQPVTSEVVDKLDADRGGIPVYVDGRLCVLEEFRLPASFDPARVRVFNTNVFHFEAHALAGLDQPWSFFRVQKQVDGAPVIQFERLVNEVTSFLPTRYLHVPRLGVESRFLPVKDVEELAARRAENELVARSRGML